MLDTTVACGGKKVFSKTAARLHRVGANEWQFALTAVIFTAHTFALHLFPLQKKGVHAVDTFFCHFVFMREIPH